MIRNLSLFLLSSIFLTTKISAHTADSSKGIAASCYALFISIADYPNEKDWPKANSSEDISNLTFFVKNVSSNPSIQVLQDKNATKKNIINSINILLQKVSKGDKVFIHFSGGGMQLEDGSTEETDGLDEAFMPYDAPSFQKYNRTAPGKSELSHLLVDDELVPYIDAIRKKLTATGQFLFTIDASYFGPAESKSTATLGRGGFLEVNAETGDKAPFIMITACTEKQTSYFLKNGTDTLTRSFSAALKHSTEQIAGTSIVSYDEFFPILYKELKKLSPSQNATINGDFSGSFLLSTKPVSTTGADEKIIGEDSRLFILSIGISNYKGPYEFANCAEDANLFTETVTASFNQNKNGGIKSYQLLDNNATKEKILAAINEIIVTAKDNDVFAFFFAGFTNQPMISEGNYQETWFYPATKKTVSVFSRTGFTENEVISLSELKRLFDYLKCDKQLLFTEAGPSKNFKREFVKSMIKTNPVIADLVKRNRVIIVPTLSGFDYTKCPDRIEHGPGIYYFSSLLNQQINIWKLFSDNKDSRQDVVYKFTQAQSKCNYPLNEYMSFFFEKEFVEDLQYYFAKDESGSTDSRGIGKTVQDQPAQVPVIKNKYALVIGTNNFNTWQTLQNPVNDAVSIADTLKNLFGFTTKVLRNPGAGEIYKALYDYNNLLKEDDQFLLYVAGHGYFDTTLYRDGFIVAKDSRDIHADTFLTTYIPFNQVRTITDNFKARQVLVLLDVCFSGAFDNSEETIGSNTGYGLTSKLDKRSVTKKLQMVTRKYITAGSRVEEVPDNFKGGHSPFAWFVLDGLRRAAKDKKYISSGMLFKYIQSYLEDTVPLQSGFGKDQLRSGSEFIFLAKEKEQ